MIKKTKLLFITPLLFLLAACAHNDLSVSQSNYKADEMVAAIKGKTNPQAKVTYQINHQQSIHKAQNNKGAFVLNIPRAPHKQIIKIKSKYRKYTLQKTVQVTASQPIMTYEQFSQKYNYFLLSQHQQPIIDNKLNNTITNVIKTPQQTIRANIQDQQLMALTLIYPLNAMKTKTGVMQTSKSIIAISSLIGADGKKVLKQLAKQMREAKKNQTAIKTIYSNGKQFKLGVSSQKFYLYITH